MVKRVLAQMGSEGVTSWDSPIQRFMFLCEINILRSTTVLPL